MGNLSLGHPLSSWPLSDWKMVGGRLSVAEVHLTGGAVSSSSLTFCPPPDQSGPLGTNCPSWLLSPPHDELVRFKLWSVSTSFLLYQLWERDTSSSIPSNTNCTCRVLWLMASVVLNNLSTMLCCKSSLPCCSLLATMQFLAKTPPSLLLAMAREFGSDKLENSNLC